MQKNVPLGFLFLLLSLVAEGQRLKIFTLQQGVSVVLSPGEDLTAPGFNLEIRSLELFECIGYQLITELKTSGNAISIRLIGAQKPTECDPSMLPAMGKVFLDLAEGEYSLKIQYQTHEAFEATLSITTDSRFISVTQTGQIVKMANPKLNRIPKNLVWGKVEFRDEDARADIQSFFEELQGLGATVTDLETGNYGPFFIREKGTQKERKLSNGTLEQPFVFYYSGDLEKVKELAKNYTEKNNNRIKIHLFSSSGSAETGWSLTK